SSERSAWFIQFVPVSRSLPACENSDNRKRRRRAQRIKIHTSFIHGISHQNDTGVHEKFHKIPILILIDLE
ncbi:hypothetical protein C0J52_18480, partial [Blattella germanica]